MPVVTLVILKEKKMNIDLCAIKSYKFYRKKTNGEFNRPILKKINRQLKLRFEVVDIESFYQQVEESGNVEKIKIRCFCLRNIKSL